MTISNDKQILSGTSGALVRSRYFPRQVVTAADLTADQQYFQRRLRRHNRMLHGFGVVCGLEVVVSLDGNDGRITTALSPGYALSPNGDEIWVPEDVTLEIDCIENVQGDCLALEAPGAETQQVFLVLRYAERTTQPVPAFPDRCASVTICEATRYQEGFTLACVDTLPPGYGDDITCEELLQFFRERMNPACDRLPAGDDVLLACLTVQRQDGRVTNIEVDPSCRRLLHSIQTLQEVIACLPDRPPAQPVQVSRVIPLANAMIPTEGARLNIPIEVTFTQPVDSSTVNENSFLVEQVSFTGNNPLIDGTITYNPENLTATFNTENGLLSNHTYIITILGDGDNAVRGINGLRLDGNEDGNEGGNFASVFGIIPIFDPHLNPHDLVDPHAHIFDPHLNPHDLVDPHAHIFDPHLNPHDLVVHGVLPHQTHQIVNPGLHGFLGAVNPSEPEGAITPLRMIVEDIPGVTEAMAERLRANGISDANVLAMMDTDALAAVLDISPDTAAMLVRVSNQFRRS